MTRAVLFSRSDLGKRTDKHAGKSSYRVTSESHSRNGDYIYLRFVQLRTFEDQ